MLNEVSAVSGLSRANAQRIFEGSEGTDPTTVLDQYAPYRSGNVKPHDPSPAKREKGADQYENNEKCMNDNDEICEPAVDHGPPHIWRVTVSSQTSENRLPSTRVTTLVGRPTSSTISCWTKPVSRVDTSGTS